MAPVQSLIVLGALIAAQLASATTMTTWSGTSCNSGDVVNWSGHSVECESLANVKSLKVGTIDSGCTVTYYHDSSCSSDAQAARAGVCVGYSDGSQIKSYSWDC